MFSDLLDCILIYKYKREMCFGPKSQPLKSLLRGRSDTPFTNRNAKDCGQDKSSTFSALNFMTMSILSVQVKQVCCWQ